MILLLWALNITAQFSLLNTLVVERLIYLLIEIHAVTILLLSNNFHKTRVLFYNSLISDNYTIIIKMLVLTCTIIFLTMIIEQVKQHFSERFEFLILIALSTFSLLLLTAAHDLITFYLSIEMQSLCLYVLTAFKRTSKLSTEAGLKYFILGALSSSLLLFGMSMIYGFIGSTNFDDIVKSILNLETIDQVPLSFSLGLILLLCGLLFKLTAVPFHI
jgi:NADH-quinone oxidoreductase subunit N